MSHGGVDTKEYPPPSLISPKNGALACRWALMGWWEDLPHAAYNLNECERQPQMRVDETKLNGHMCAPPAHLAQPPPAPADLPRFTVGIDPGITGAIVVLDPAGRISSITDLPTIEVTVAGRRRTKLDLHQLGGMLTRAKLQLDRRPLGLHVYLEDIGGTAAGLGAGKAMSGSASLMRGFGALEGMLAALQIPYTLVQPRTWQRVVGLPQGLDKAARKGNSRARAAQLWPAWGDKFSRVKDDGRADAALIALYGYRLGGMEQ